MTECRVVVVREIGNLTTEQGKWLAAWMADPLDGVHLVLVAGGDAHTGRARQGGQGERPTSSGPAVSRPPACSRPRPRPRGCASAPTRRRASSTHLGDDAGRVPGARRAPRATYGDDATLDVDDVEAYLGELGTAGRFDLTNAIDRGDLGTALEVLHRMLTATSASQPKPLHPMQVMASLVFHYQRLLRLDDPAITTKEQAAEVLGMKSAGGARFPLEAARRARHRRTARSARAARAGRARPPRPERPRRTHRDRRARRAAGRAQPPPRARHEPRRRRSGSETRGATTR